MVSLKVWWQQQKETLEMDVVIKFFDGIFSDS